MINFACKIKEYIPELHVFRVSRVLDYKFWIEKVKKVYLKI